MSRETLLEAKRDAIRAAARHGARNVHVFGSVVRGEADAESDIDLIVELEPGRTLFDHTALIAKLRELLGCRVDVVSDRGLKPRFAIAFWLRPCRCDGAA